MAAQQMEPVAVKSATDTAMDAFDTLKKAGMGLLLLLKQNLLLLNLQPLQTPNKHSCLKAVQRKG